jgi:spermidine/putrescine transport system substrate-binding protein
MARFAQHLHVWVATLLALALFFLSHPLVAGSKPPTRELSLLIWTEYLDPELIKAFEKSRGVRIKSVYFESDDVRDRLVQEVEGQGFDLALVNDIMVAPYATRGWLAPIDKAAIPNLKHIDRRWLTAYPMVEDYAVPYFWGTLGIAYRKDIVTAPVTSWMDLFRPAESLRGRIIMVYDVRDTIGMALRALGYSVNTTDPEHLAAAARLLESQKPYVRSYSYVALTETSGIVTGEFAMTMLYNGDALLLRQYNKNIEYIVPKEGTNLWTDYIVVFNSSPKKDLAFDFINFLNEPKNAAKLAQYVHYATPNVAAHKYLPKEFLADPIIYPSPEVIARSESYAMLPPNTIKVRNDIFARLTR